MTEWQTVPKQPTYNDMLTAGRDVFNAYKKRAAGGDVILTVTLVEEIYKAMLAAAPAPPA
jgi:hypothetical protein